ncbi:hypothetical protein COY62_03705 [bacterium (Candidatus Howlettbacteria) CG_4_10_14_0_8_um_filter_40_9]|nr:MAG: hypothetical protein COY62_03705 [bacterium (Candidatus Howlettbacteria) CG_4_10_14_0_8_um_filter_40_9]
MKEQIKHQSIFIRGGEAFDNKEEFYSYIKNRPFDPYYNPRRWTDWLEWSLSEKFDSFTPMMPNKQWADYEGWKIWFERYLPYINHNKKSKLIMIGHSLGTIFLAKYLSENKFPKKIHQMHWVCSVFENKGLVDEKITTFEFDVHKLKNIESQVDKIFFYHSKDDHLVPFSHSKKFMKYMPKAHLFSFKDRGHFNQPAFMEILQVIQENL